MVPIRIAGTGSYVPEKVLTNFDLEKFLDTSDEWIVQRTGIKERRIARPDQASSDLAAEAAKIAMEDAGISPHDLDLIVMATVTPDFHSPSAANCLQALIDAPQAFSFDITAACSGFIFAMDVASRYLQSGAAKTVLVVAGEVMSRVQDWTDRANCVLWGDGAGAAVLQPGDANPQILATYLGSDGRNGKDLRIAGMGSSVTPLTHESLDQHVHTLKLINASASVRVAVKHFVQSIHAVLDQTGLTMDDVDHFIPHQANLRMIQQVAKRIKVDMDRFVVTIDRYANISSASCAIAMDEAIREGRIKKGDLVCVPVFGGGITWGAALIRF
ncbi:3-oxoacyl-ACP synthase III family protein [Dethiosulfatarculus sandiegensis]|uniref:Beta-ketoacyl-[acyl-carrier-protein] synthase III n=1 Tax=Dethiosulfatarculus sandiegensis TaxID=1429043 RepID=A0A0D2IZP9_9BACT|nr:beta-ketoacyl-ACP synthase III [Dethiosulfatarculus sandiegensis]KIX11469.1 3-oxoacyl-ACP synthase [Dethiosulfatarculus sandiegensis]